MKIIGREKEKSVIERCLDSGRPEFLVVYGRRRVGKTFLIKQFFNGSFAFYATGVNGIKTKGQLKAFHESLKEYGSNEKMPPDDWMEAFSRLKRLLAAENVKRDPQSGKRVIFLDELPWMDTARSDFKAALDWFWNSWASAEADILLIVCGSATSWIIDNILESKGGFYNRITNKIHLMPFTLGETEKLFNANGIVMTRNQMVESYMIFGGIPYYLNLFDSRISLSQNVDELVFKENGQLRYEYSALLGSLFKNPAPHYEIIRLLAGKKSGMTRNEMISGGKLSNGAGLTKALLELEQCGFIRKFTSFSVEKNCASYQLTDPFILFSLHFLSDGKSSSWVNHINTPAYYAWRGNAFEIVCLNHIPQIRQSLGISGIESAEYSWRSKKSKPGAQIDLLIDRKDGVINLCEMKYTTGEYEIDCEYEKKLENKRFVFTQETGTKKAVHVTLIAQSGLKQNLHSSAIQRLITAADLFTQA